MGIAGNVRVCTVPSSSKVLLRTLSPVVYLYRYSTLTQYRNRYTYRYSSTSTAQVQSPTTTVRSATVLVPVCYSLSMGRATPYWVLVPVVSNSTPHTTPPLHLLLTHYEYRTVLSVYAAWYLAINLNHKSLLSISLSLSIRSITHQNNNPTVSVQYWDFANSWKTQIILNYNYLKFSLHRGTDLIYAQFCLHCATVAYDYSTCTGIW